MGIQQSVYTDIFNATDDAVISIAATGYYRVTSGAYTSLEVQSTVDAGTEIDIEPGVSFSGTMTLAGDLTTISANANFTVSGRTTVTGTKVSILGSGSGSMAGITISSPSAYFCLDGGGPGFLVTAASGDAISNDRSFSLIKNCSLSTTGSGVHALHNQGAYAELYNVIFVDTAGAGDCISNISADVSILNCRFLDSIDYLVVTTGARTICYNCNMSSPTSEKGCLISGASADDGIFNSNIIEANNVSAGGIVIDTATSENNIITSNRLEVAVSDSGTGTTVANNNPAAI